MRHIAYSSLWLGLLASAAYSADTATQPATVAMTIAKKEYKLEIAATDATREKGLMNRESMADDHGMIFIFTKAERWGFWMKNTLIPLDLLYLDASGKIVDLTTLKPQDETQFTPRRAALYVIELNAGTIKALDLKRGDSLTLPEKLPEAK